MLVFVGFLVLCFVAGAWLKDRSSSWRIGFVTVLGLAVCAAYFVFHAL